MALRRAFSFPLTPLSSPLDDRLYRMIRLPNKLTSLLISDPKADMAAAALQVNVGNFSDSLPGIAHFLEHMLFLGTEKYPDENSYSAFLNMNGGYSNAYTASECTNYQFNIKYDKLEPALDRFAQFFISPLFTPSATDRELNAVNNEFVKNVNNDSWRMYQILKHQTNSKHPVYHFGSGNFQTLRDEPLEKGIDLREALLEFYKYYSADRMNLAVLGRESLDELESYVTSKFSSIEVKSKPLPDYSNIPPFDDSFYHKCDYIVPMKDLRSLEIMWPIPSVNSHYHSKPASLLSHLIGHEGKGSLLSVLKSLGLATSLSAGISLSHSTFAMFYVKISLSEIGMGDTKLILRMVFAYIRMLKATPNSEFDRLAAEVKALYEMNFRFKSQEQPLSYVTNLANNMQLYDSPDVISGPWLLSDYNLPLVQSFLSCLTTKCRVSLVSKMNEYRKTRVEQYTGAEYSTEPLHELDILLRDESGVKDSTLSEIEKKLHVPHANPFLATDFTIFGKADEDTKLIPPAKLLDTAKIRLWHKLDQTFLKPKANVIVQIISPFASVSPLADVMNSLFVSLAQDSLNEFTYDAECAGLSYSLNSSYCGIQVTFGGYNEKLPVLAKTIMETITNFDVKEDRFAIYKEQLLRSLRNFDKEQPYAHGLFHLMVSLESTRWHRLEKLQALTNATPSDLKTHLNRFFSSIYLECLAHGNISSDAALKFASDLLLLKPCIQGQNVLTSQFPERRMVKLSPGQWYLHARKGLNIEDDNSAVVCYYQFGPDTLEMHAAGELLAHICNEPCFNQLRTKEQLGYMVWSGLQEDASYHILGYRIIVQSGERDASYLDSRVENFVASIEEILTSMSDADFQHNVEALIAVKLEADKTLSSETQRHWSRIGTRRYEFNREFKEVEILKTLKREQILSLYRDYVAKDGKNRTKFSAQIFGKKHLVPESNPESVVVLIDDEIAFRRGMPLFPSYL